MQKFSVLMSVYVKENPEYLSSALDSLLSSSLVPDEVVLVEDGPLTTELYDTIAQHSTRLNINSIKIPSNVGLGQALNIGLSFCKNELVARFDTDDINRPDRFEKQLAAFNEDPSLQLLGGLVEEFHINPGDQGIYRLAPDSARLIRYAKKRNPFNHPTVMFKKTAVIKCGGYQNDFLYEDYSLWVRMLNIGTKADNLQEVLVDMRAGPEMYRRRGGVKYALSEAKAQIKFYRSGFIKFPRLVANLIVRSPVRLTPHFVRKFLYMLTRG